MTIAQEFKEFAVKGNVMDLAVGVIIGGAFTGIVSFIIARSFLSQNYVVSFSWMRPRERHP